MVLGFTLLDIALLLWLLWQTIYGLRVGLLVSLGGLLGLVAGAVAAFFAIPGVNSLVTDSAWRVAAVVVTVIVLLGLGHAIGVRIGGAISRRGVRGPLNVINRVLGGALNLAVGALMISVIAFSVTNLGIPSVSGLIGKSKVIATIDTLIPTPVKSAVAQLRSLALSEGIPQILGQISPTLPGTPPSTSTNTPALIAASASVLRISGTAYQCGQNQTGSGYVAAPGRVITNAHVVAGVTRPVVDVPGGGSMAARVVYFDPKNDLAVLAVDGLSTQPLVAGKQLTAGAAGAFSGYPHGGPFESKPAAVESVAPMLVPDIYGNDPHSEEIYQLSADVQPGNSGGPLLDMEGRVVGVVFAKATQNIPVGYAFTLTELGPVSQKAESLTSQVSSGNCIKE